MFENHGQETPRFVAAIFAYLDKKDQAFNWLNKAMEVEETKVMKEIFRPHFWKLHEDPRWTELRERLKMSAERLDAIEFEVYLPD